ncbi:AI-2E family transporter [Clostridium sp. PL3]|uniref:AI-2E family transporter n=1 Tax=Clostridium thailandense TaxID=2794346 RepID=A0A949WSP3_9CLOT|nr:AI-2E family transporter [Clostridium thailandense]MBV7275405.1 AI-2E family transporter [Clostridium thailandense]
MNIIRSLWEKEMVRKVFTFILIILTVYFLRGIVDLFLLTFLFTYLIYNMQRFIINSLKSFIKINELSMTIILYFIIFILLGYFIYRFIPIIISQSITIVNEFSGMQSKTNINRIEQYLFPIAGKVDIEGYIKNEANSIFQFIANIGKWGINILLSLILSLFFIIEQSKVKKFLKRFNNSRLSDISKCLGLFSVNFLNSFGKVVQVQVIIAVTNAILSMIALSIMGFPQLIALSFMIFIFSLIPIAGTIVSIFPLCIIAYSIGGIIKVLYVLLVIAILYLLESYVLNPQFMAAKTHIPVFVVFIVLIISEHFMGIWGLLLGIPLFMFILDLLEVNLNKL